MLKKVRINVASRILRDGESTPEIANESYVGSMRSEGDEVKLSYSNDTEGGKVSTSITVAGGGVLVTRKGALASELYFSENGIYKSFYSIPPYRFDLTATTRTLKINIDESRCEIEISYELDVGGARSVNDMHICVFEVEK